MLNLLAKDFKLFFSKEQSLSRRITSLLVTIIFLGAFVAIEVFLFISILKKISNYNNAPIAFTNLFLFIISILLILFNVHNAEKLFFNPKDIEQLSTRPIENRSVVLSKLIFLFITHYAVSLLFIYPLIFSYGLLMYKSTMFYYLGIFYPALSFLFEGGIALLLAYPYNILKKYLNRHIIVKFVLIISLIIAGSIAYAKILELFIEIVAGKSINSLFTIDTINTLVRLRTFEFPSNFLIDIIFSNRISKLLILICIGGGIFLLGVNVAIFVYNYVRIMTVNQKVDKKIHNFSLLNKNKSLIKKEFILLFRNSDYIITFIGLLIVQPLLLFLVIKALNTIFKTGIFSYYLMVFPNFIPLIDLLIILLFTVIISSGANSYLKIEKRAVKIMKTIPISPINQLIVKLLIPFSLSFISLFISLLVLCILGVINIIIFFFALILSSILLITFMMISLIEEFKIKNKTKNTFISTCLAYGMPFFCTISCLLFSYLNINIFISIFMNITIFSVILIVIFMYLKKNFSMLFINLEEGN